MRILYLTAFVPYPETRGGRLRVRNLIRVLHRGADLSLASLDSDSSPLDERPFPFEAELRTFEAVPHRLSRRRAALEALSRGVPYECALMKNSSMHRCVQKLLDDQQPDIVLISRLSMLQYAPDAWLDRVVLDQHDLSRRLWRIMIGTEQSSAARFWQRRNLANVERYEAAAYPRIAGFVSVSDEEYRETSEFCNGEVPGIVVPNGVDTERYRPDGEVEAQDDSIVLFGAMDQRRNVDAARFLVEDIMPRVWAVRPSCIVRIVGRSPASSVQQLGRMDNVIVTGEVADERPYISQSVLAVAPYRMGSGVKHKVPISLAMGKPLVATRNAVHGVSVTSGQHCIVTDEADEFAGAILSILGDPEAARSMGARAREFAVSELTWQSGAAGLMPFLESLRHTGAGAATGPHRLAGQLPD